jgi:hypothetical protein
MSVLQHFIPKLVTIEKIDSIVDVMFTTSTGPLVISIKIDESALGGYGQWKQRKIVTGFRWCKDKKSFHVAPTNSTLQVQTILEAVDAAIQWRVNEVITDGT